jgi:cytochrome P450
MLDRTTPVIPSAPVVHPKDLPAIRLLFGSIRNSLAIWPDHAFDVGFRRNKLFGIESVLVNEPAGVRHVMATNVANYVRPAILPRLFRPLAGQGVFLAEASAWRRQRRLLSPSFTPHRVNILLPHFIAAGNGLIHQIEGQSSADLLAAYKTAALDAVLRALFSMPDQEKRARLGDLVREYFTGPGSPNILDAFASSEASFGFALRGRRAFQKRWSAAIDAIVAARRGTPHDTDHRDLLDLLIAARDPETADALAADEVRDQCATMIFAGYETTARLLFWTSYLLTLDRDEQARVRAEVAAFPPERVTTLDDLGHWPRSRLVLLEALRLYPPVPIMLREPVEDVGQRLYSLRRHRKHWQHPTAFIPDRFAGQPSPWTRVSAYGEAFRFMFHPC